MNQIDGVCQTIEKTINQAVQKTLDQLEKDCDLICSTISNKLEQDRFDLSTYSIACVRIIVKATVHPKINPNSASIFFLSPVVLFINLDSFGVSCLVFEISAIKISAFSQILCE